TGINITGPTPSATNIKGNVISTVNSSSLVINAGLTTAIAGIYTQANVAQTIDSNTVSTLNSTSANSTAVVVSGIILNGRTSTSGNCTRNRIYGLTNSNPSGWITGINTIFGSTAAGWTVANNMISLITNNPLLIYGIRD